MLSLQGDLVRRVAQFLGVPPGTGEFITVETRRKLLMSVGSSVLLSLLDMVGVLAMVPMMQYITGQDPDAGALGKLSEITGRPSETGLVVGWPP